jgi:hypothetical protein
MAAGLAGEYRHLTRWLNHAVNLRVSIVTDRDASFFIRSREG